MYEILLWNIKSPNYNANNFVKKNGTGTLHADTQEKAVDMAAKILESDFNIGRAVIVHPDGDRIDLVRLTLDNDKEGES